MGYFLGKAVVLNTFFGLRHSRCLHVACLDIIAPDCKDLAWRLMRGGLPVWPYRTDLHKAVQLAH